LRSIWLPARPGHRAAVLRFQILTQSLPVGSVAFENGRRSLRHTPRRPRPGALPADWRRRLARYKRSENRVRLAVPVPGGRCQGNRIARKRGGGTRALLRPESRLRNMRAEWFRFSCWVIGALGRHTPQCSSLAKKVFRPFLIIVGSSPCLIAETTFVKTTVRYRSAALPTAN
jgi:hypothetical protein